MDSHPHAAVTELSAMLKHCDRMRSLSRNDTPDYSTRIQHLEALEKLVLNNKDRIVEAVDADFGGEAGCRGKPYCTLGDVWAGLNTVREVKAHLHEWMASPREVELGFKRFPFNVMGKAKMYSKPLGLVLALTPWNFPFHIPISAIGDILGAGNRCVVKPSEHTPRTSALLAELVADAFSPDVLTVYTGGPDVATSLTSFPFDHILFVGSGAVGKKILAAAAPNLTKVTLELGGKNPLFVCPDYDLKSAAEHIALGKLENGGQVCTNVDTVFVEPGKVQELVGHMKEALKQRWGNKPLAENPQFVSMIHDGHFARTKGLLDDARKKGAQVISLDPIGCSEYEGKGNNFPPHVIVNPSDEALVSSEELFSPCLVVREMSLSDAVAYVNARPEPLACYLFTNNDSTKEDLARRVRCGGMTVNDINKHTVVGPLPFGGVGASGMGCYHGIEGFKNFSHQMSVYDVKPVGLLGRLWQKVGPNIRLPYADEDVKQIQSFLDPLPPLDAISRTFRVLFYAGVAMVALRSSRVRQAMLPLARECVKYLES